MFWSSPSGDIEMIFFFLVVSFILSLAIFFFSRKWPWSIFVFLTLSNTILFFGLDYNLAKIYGVYQLFYFAKNIFPYINLLLFFIIIIHFIKTRYAK